MTSVSLSQAGNAGTKAGDSSGKALPKKCSRSRGPPHSKSLKRLRTNLTGLSSDEAAQRLERDGPNTIAKDEGQSRLGILAKAAVNPLVLCSQVSHVVQR